MTDTQTDAAPGKSRTWPRWTAFGVLALLAAVLLLAALAARFARSELLDTDRYVETVAPLAQDPAIQLQVADTVTTQVMDRVDIGALTEQVASAIQRERLSDLVAGLEPLIANQVEEVVHRVTLDVAQSETFATAWEEANRLGHRALVAALTGREGAVSVTDGTVSLELGPIVDEAKQRLMDRGFDFASRIPALNATFVLLQSDDLARAQEITDRLDRWATWLPWVALAVAVGAVLAAPNRRRGLLILGLVVAGTMALVGIGLAIARTRYLDAVPAETLSAAAAASAFDIIAHPLRLTLRAVSAVGLLIALGAFAVGPARVAVATRAWFNRTLDSVRQGARVGPVETWMAQNRRVVTLGILIAAALVLVLWPYPTGAVVLVTAAVALLALLAVATVAHPALTANASHP